MIAQGEWALLRPWWLLAVPLAFAAFAAAWRRAPLGDWVKAFDPPLLAAMERFGRLVPGAASRNTAPAILSGLLVLALAGPARESDGLAGFRNLDGLVLAIDLSRSAAAGGNLAEALTSARLVASRAGSRPVALVVYGGDAYVAANFTTDAGALSATIGVLDGETVPDPGSKPERALGVARQILAGANVVAGDVVLVSDGGGIGEDAMDEARRIAAAGSRVSTLLVPALAQAPVDMPEPAGGALASLAGAGGGIAGDIFASEEVAAFAAAGTGERMVEAGLGFLGWREFGRYLLVFALLPALLLFRRRA